MPRLIDADAFRNEWLEDGENEYVYDTNAVLDSIDRQPTIDAEPVRHSRMSNPNVKGVKPMCLECHTAYIKDPYWNYCPFCGAKMDGGADNA